MKKFSFIILFLIGVIIFYSSNEKTIKIESKKYNSNNYINLGICNLMKDLDGNCASKGFEYAKANPGTCCIAHPETCCNTNVGYTDFGWFAKYFLNKDSTWRLEICCSSQLFVDKASKTIVAGCCLLSDFKLNHSSICNENVCNDPQYAKDNPGACCDMYPETCCNVSDFIDNEENWTKYFTGHEGEWKKNICCESKEFSDKYPDKCVTATQPESEPEPPKSVSCADEEYEKEHHCSCKKLVCDENFPKDCIGKFIYDVYQIIKIVSTILVVVMTILDFVKAMSAQDDEKMKKSINDAKKRVIIVVVLLFGPTIINFLLGLFSNGTWSTCGIK